MEIYYTTILTCCFVVFSERACQSVVWLVLFPLDDMNKACTGLNDSTLEPILWNGMIYNTCRIWIKSGMEETPFEMTELVRRQLKMLGIKLSAIQ